MKEIATKHLKQPYLTIKHGQKRVSSICGRKPYIVNIATHDPHTPSIDVCEKCMARHRKMLLRLADTIADIKHRGLPTVSHKNEYVDLVKRVRVSRPT